MSEDFNRRLIEHLGRKVKERLAQKIDQIVLLLSFLIDGFEDVSKQLKESK